MTRPLAGIRVLDLSQVIAGPFGGALLAQSGADVIKIEGLTGEMSRSSIATTFYGLNYGKRGLALNLRSERGQEVMYRLSKTADVVIENFRPGVMDRLQVGYEKLSQINTRLIFVSVSAFGQDGPYAHRPGFDPLLQAMTGIERTQGGEHNPPVFLRIAVTDYTTAMMQAAAVTFALYSRERTGQGQRLDLSLLRSGIFVNGEAFTRYPSRPPRALPDKGQNGFGPLDRMYRCADDWIFLLVQDDQQRWFNLLSLPDLAPLRSDPLFADAAARSTNGTVLTQQLERLFLTRPAAEWLAGLEAAGVPCAPVVTGYDRRFFEDVQPIVNRYSVAGEHSESGRVEHPGAFVKFSAAEHPPEGRSSPGLGEHTKAILAELGYSSSQIEGMHATGIVL
jgi:crotonobetainyl-CoA:carnitine CoA-transferase CaiB-like acyl-CoA transferase